MNDGSVVKLVAGKGLLARRQQELIFTTGNSSELMSAFDKAPLGESFEFVTQFAEEQNLEVDDFVVIDWSQGVRVAVFGEIEVTSDDRSLPRLSAAGAGTWVERSMRRTEPEVLIGVKLAEANGATDLRAGVVEAGGFALTCTPGAIASVRTASLEESARGALPVIENEYEPLVEDVAPESLSESFAVELPVEAPVVEPFIESPEPEPSVSKPSGDVSGGALAISVLGGQQSSPEAPDDDGSLTLRDDLTIVPDEAMQQEIVGLVGDVEGSDSVSPIARQVRSRVCGACSSANPEMSVGCTACGAPLMPGEHNVTLADAPLWQLVFADGSVELVDKTLLLGRKPSLRTSDEESEVRLLPLDCSQVSGIHLEVRAVDWELLITDQGSSNGSFVLTSGDGQLVQLDAYKSHRVERGTVIQVGTKRFEIAVD